LFLFSRGERTCHAYEVQLQTPYFTKLPSFEHGTLQSGFAFLPKVEVDVKQVEILRAFRLTPTTIEIISFQIPRAKVDYFQDDIFVPTQDTRVSVLSPAEWFAGKIADQPLVDLRPEEMELLSNAPESQVKINTRNKIAAGPVVTDSQREEAFMDKLFQMAKKDEEEVEYRDGKPVQAGAPPIDDDDW